MLSLFLSDDSSAPKHSDKNLPNYDAVIRTSYEPCADNSAAEPSAMVGRLHGWSSTADDVCGHRDVTIDASSAVRFCCRLASALLSADALNRSHDQPLTRSRPYLLSGRYDRFIYFSCTHFNSYSVETQLRCCVSHSNRMSSNF